MRIYTLLVSMAAHAGAVVAIVVATVTAADVFPPVKRALDFVEVVAPPPPPPPVKRAQAPAATTASNVPLAAPVGIHEEPATSPLEEAVADPGILPGDAIAIPDPPADIPPPPPVREPVRVGGAIRPPERLSAPPPIYPSIARAARVQGTVILEATIGVEGTVSDVRPLRSIPLLDAAAIEAVRQWRFTPTLLNGVPVPVVMTVTVTFALQ